MIWFASLAAAAAVATPPPTIPPAPLPIPPVADYPSRHKLALAYDAPPATVNCAGRTVPVRRAEAPPVLTTTWYSDSTQPVRPAFRFRIDRTGRPLGIALDPSSLAGSPLPDVEALQATLAVWTFAVSGGEASGCRVDFPGVWTNLADAPLPLVHRLIFQEGLAVEEMRKLRVRAGGGGDCQGDEPPLPRVMHFPRYERVAKQPGRQSWTLVGFDIDAHGRARRVRRLDGSGSQILDRESLAAVSRSTFQPKAATGCVSVLRRSAAPLPAPASPEPLSYARADDVCPGEDILSYRGVISYPREFQRRRIEGWAMIRFDVASWGQVGAVQVVASEPTAAFGQAAVNFVSSAHAKRPGKPLVGCIVPVRFKMPELTPGPAEAEIQVQAR